MTQQPAPGPAGRETGVKAREEERLTSAAGHEGAQEGEEGHGHSVAAWTAVGVILVASLIMALAVVFPSVLWFVVGAVLAVVGGILGKVLAMAGYGQRAGTYQAAHRSGVQRAELPGRHQHDSGTQ